MVEHTDRLRIAVTVEDLPLKVPFRISGYTFESMPVIVVSVSEDGHEGRGEAAGVYYLKDDVSHMIAALEQIQPAVRAGLSRARLREAMPAGGARNALDCALWELEARQCGRSVWQLAGLAEPRPLVTTLTLSAEPPAQMAEAARAYGDVKALKAKLTGEVEQDIARVRSVRAACPGAWLGVDANQGYAPASLAALVPTLVACDVRLIEQPFPRGRDGWMDGLSLPVAAAADESCQGLHELDAMAGRFDVVNIKLDKCGGLTEGLMMAARAQELGLEIMVGNMIGTSLAMAPAFVLGQLCRIVDLDGPVWLQHDRPPAAEYRRGEVWVPPDSWGR